MEKYVWNTPKIVSPLVSEDPLSLRERLKQLSYQEREKRLMLAVLTDAVGCIERYRNGRGVQSWVECRAALRWILDQDRKWPFSFENICLALDLNADRLRLALCAPLVFSLRATHVGTFPLKASGGPRLAQG
jgi:hypothetical protein